MALKELSFAIAIVAIFMSPISSIQSQATVSDYISLTDENTVELKILAEYFMQNKEYYRAGLLWQKIIYINPLDRNAIDAISTISGNPQYLFEQGNEKWLEQDYCSAKELFEKAAAAGSNDAYLKLGILHLKALCGPGDSDSATRNFEKGAAGGSAACQRNLGYIYANGIGTPRDPVKAIRYYEMAASGGMPLAAIELGKIYLDGTLGERQLSKAESVLTPVALKNVPEAQYLLYSVYCSLNDRPQADHWLRKAADNGHPKAQYELGIMLIEEGKKEGDFQAALDLLLSSFEEGIMEAAHPIGLIYYRGSTGKRDYSEAFKWMHFSAGKLKNNEAVRYVAYMLEKGLGIEEDKRKALQLYFALDQQGDGIAAYRIGHCFERGMELRKNLPAALMFYEKALERGYSGAGDAIKAVNREMNYERVAGEWRYYAEEDYQAVGRGNDILSRGGSFDDAIAAALDEGYYNEIKGYYDINSFDNIDTLMNNLDFSSPVSKNQLIDSLLSSMGIDFETGRFDIFAALRDGEFNYSDFRSYLLDSSSIIDLNMRNTSAYMLFGKQLNQLDQFEVGDRLKEIFQAAYLSPEMKSIIVNYDRNIYYGDAQSSEIIAYLKKLSASGDSHAARMLELLKNQ